MIFWYFFREVYRLAAKKMVKLIEDHLKDNDNILDLGCGSGILAKTIKETKQIKILGVDIKDQRVENIPFKQFDGKKLPFNENFFDIVLISFVLHHTSNPTEILNEAKRVGKKIIIFEDVPENLLEKIRCYLHWFFWGVFSKNFSKFNFFSQKEWQEIFKKLNLKLIEMRYFRFVLNYLDPVSKKIFILEK